MAPLSASPYQPEYKQLHALIGAQFGNKEEINQLYIIQTGW